MIRTLKALLTCSTIFLASISFAETIQCKVVGVNDGDTITCLTTNKQQIKVRLNQIDAPENGQAFGNKSKQALSNMIFGEQVAVYTQGIDRYKRTLGTIYAYPKCPTGTVCKYRAVSEDINLKMIKQGMAWVYVQYAKTPEYFAAEKVARANKVGLWADAHPVAPWEYRKSKKNGSQITVSGGAAFTCGTKQYCKEMKSCDEAKFYLKQCGVSSLDGNNDGIPCNKLCRR